MTNQSPVPLAADVDAGKRRVNGPELALWIIGIVLLVVAGALVYGFIKVVLAEVSNPVQQNDIGFYSVWSEASSLYTPGLVTAGIVCIALAIFLRGLDINARRRDARRTSEAAVPAPVSAESAASQSAPPPTQPQPLPQPPAPATTASNDYSAFMRPSDSATELNK